MDKDIEADRKLEALFDQAFAFQAPPPPAFENDSELPLKLSMETLDMLAAAGGNAETLEAMKKIKAASEREKQR